MYIYIYIYVVGSITWPPQVNNLATFISLFFFFFIFPFSISSSFCRENDIKKTKL